MMHDCRNAWLKLAMKCSASRVTRGSCKNCKKMSCRFSSRIWREIVKDATASGRLKFGSTEEGIDWGKAIFICVGTPPLPNGEADLSAIEAVARVSLSALRDIAWSSRKARYQCRRERSYVSTWAYTERRPSNMMWHRTPSFFARDRQFWTSCI